MNKWITCSLETFAIISIWIQVRPFHFNTALYVNCTRIYNRSFIKRDIQLYFFRIRVHKLTNGRVSSDSVINATNGHPQCLES